MLPRKPIEFLGASRRDLAAFPDEARHTAGFQLDRIQRWLAPDDWKPLPIVGSGVIELRVQDSRCELRVLYVAKLADVVYVLHAFLKKREKTASITLARTRYAKLTRTQ